MTLTTLVTTMWPCDWSQMTEIKWIIWECCFALRTVHEQGQKSSRCYWYSCSYSNQTAKVTKNTEAPRGQSQIRKYRRGPVSEGHETSEAGVRVSPLTPLPLRVGSGEDNARPPLCFKFCVEMALFGALLSSILKMRDICNIVDFYLCPLQRKCCV